MEPRKVIVVQDDCPFCNFIKKEFEAKGVDVDIVDSSTKEGSEWADRHDVGVIPQCLLVTKGEDGETSRVCTPEEFDALFEAKKK